MGRTASTRELMSSIALAESLNKENGQAVIIDNISVSDDSYQSYQDIDGNPNSDEIRALFKFGVFASNVKIEGVVLSTQLRDIRFSVKNPELVVGSGGQIGEGEYGWIDSDGYKKFKSIIDLLNYILAKQKFIDLAQFLDKVEEAGIVKITNVKARLYKGFALKVGPIFMLMDGNNTATFSMV